MSPVISGQGVWKQCVCEVLRTPVWDLAGRPWPRLIFEQKVYWKVISCMWATDRLRVCTIRTQTHTIESVCVFVCGFPLPPMITRHLFARIEPVLPRQRDTFRQRQSPQIYQPFIRSQTQHTGIDSALICADTALRNHQITAPRFCF